MNEIKTCETCKHFRQHYGKFGKRYTVIGCGHCVYPMLKHRKPDTKTYGHYKANECQTVVGADGNPPAI